MSLNLEHEDELIDLELLELEKPDEHPIEVSDDKNEPNPPKKINQTSITRFSPK